MRIRLAAAFVSVLLSCVAVGQSPPSTTPQTVVVPGGNLRLKGYFWSPARISSISRRPVRSWLWQQRHRAYWRFEITEAVERLAPTFIKHDHAFLYLFRRGQGISADQGLSMRDVLQREKAAKGEEARKR